MPSTRLPVRSQHNDQHRGTGWVGPNKQRRAHVANQKASAARSQQGALGERRLSTKAHHQCGVTAATQSSVEFQQFLRTWNACVFRPRLSPTQRSSTSQLCSRAIGPADTGSRCAPPTLRRSGWQGLRFTTLFQSDRPAGGVSLCSSHLELLRHHRLRKRHIWKK